MHLDIAELSERGGRTENQDAFAYWQGPDVSYFVVCDGAGGHLGGGVAATVAVNEAIACMQKMRACTGANVEAAMRCANDALVREQKAQPQYAQMRATIVALALDLKARTAAWGHLGDSRLYCFRDGRILTQTRDHSVVQSFVDAGYLQPDQLRTSPDRSKLLSALGDAEQFEPAVEPKPFALASGDRFLLCTDGLWEYVQESEMEDALSESSAAQAWLDALQRLVVARGKRKHDNYSALAIWCE